MKKIITIALLLPLSLLAQNTQQRTVIQTSQFARQINTNETAQGYINALGLTTNLSTTASNITPGIVINPSDASLLTNAAFLTLSASARGAITNVADEAAQKATNTLYAPALTGALPAISGASLTSLNGTAISSGTVAEARVDATIARDSELNTASNVVRTLAIDATNSLAAGLVAGTVPVAAEGVTGDLNVDSVNTPTLTVSGAISGNLIGNSTRATNSLYRVTLTAGAGDITTSLQSLIDSYTNAYYLSEVAFVIHGSNYITAPINLRREGQILEGGSEARAIIATTGDFNAVQFVPAPNNLGGGKAGNFYGVRNLTISGPGRGSSTKSGVFVGHVADPTDVDSHHNLVKLEDLDITGFRYGVSQTNTYAVTCLRVEAQECTVGFNNHKADMSSFIDCKTGFTSAADAIDRDTVGYFFTGNTFTPRIVGGQTANIWRGITLANTGGGELTVIGGEYSQIRSTNCFAISSGVAATFISPYVSGINTNSLYPYDITGDVADAVKIVGGIYNNINSAGDVVSIRGSSVNVTPFYQGYPITVTNLTQVTRRKIPALSPRWTTSDTVFDTAGLYLGNAGIDNWGIRLAATTSRDLCWDRNWGGGSPQKDEMIRFGFQTGYIWAKGGFYGSALNLTNYSITNLFGAPLSINSPSTSDTAFDGAISYLGQSGINAWGFRLASTTSRDLCFDRNWGAGSPQKDEMVRFSFETGVITAKGGYVGNGGSISNLFDNLSTTDLVIDTWRTNTTTSAQFVVCSVELDPNTTGIGAAAITIDYTRNDSWDTTIPVQKSLLSDNQREILSAMIPVGARWALTNLSSGGGSASVVVGSTQVVSQ